VLLHGSPWQVSAKRLLEIESCKHG